MILEFQLYCVRLKFLQFIQYMQCCKNCRIIIILRYVESLLLIVSKIHCIKFPLTSLQGRKTWCHCKECPWSPGQISLGFFCRSTWSPLLMFPGKLHYISLNHGSLWNWKFNVVIAQYNLIGFQLTIKSEF